MVARGAFSCRYSPASTPSDTASLPFRGGAREPRHALGTPRVPGPRSRRGEQGPSGAKRRVSSSWRAAACPRRSRRRSGCRRSPSRANSSRRAGARVGAGGADARDDRVDQVLHARAGRVEEHPRGGDALLEQRLAGPVVRRLLDGAVAARRAPRPCRRTPCTAGRRRPAGGRPGDSYVPANQEPIMTLDAPAASAIATSRGCRTPPSAQTCLPYFLASAAHSSTAENCGPADAGHHAGGAHRAGADADLDDVGARLDQVAHALGGDDVARDDRHLRVERRGPP